MSLGFAAFKQSAMSDCPVFWGIPPYCEINGAFSRTVWLTIYLESPVEPTRTKIIQSSTITNANKTRDPPSILKKILVSH